MLILFEQSFIQQFLLAINTYQSSTIYAPINIKCQSFQLEQEIINNQEIGSKEICNYVNPKSLINYTKKLALHFSLAL